jgi:hypothetical protein
MRKGVRFLINRETNKLEIAAAGRRPIGALRVYTS